MSTRTHTYCISATTMQLCNNTQQNLSLPAERLRPCPEVQKQPSEILKKFIRIKKNKTRHCQNGQFFVACFKHRYKYPQHPNYGAQMTDNEDRSDEILSFYLKSLLDTLSDGVYITDQKGMTLHVNTMYESLTGLKREDIVGHNVRDLKDQGVFNIILNPEVVKTGKPVTQVQTNMHERRLVLSGYPIFDSKGKVAMVVTYARDITIISNMKDQITQQQELIEKYHTNLDYINRQKIQKAPLIIISKEMSQVLATLRLVASTDITVLLLGETGVGKDVLARHIHERSTRSSQPFSKWTVRPSRKVS